MRKTILLLSGAVLTVTLLIAACNGGPGFDKSEKKENVEKDSVWFVKRGEQLVSSVGCDDCHSPKRMGPNGIELIPELRLSGYTSKNVLPEVNTGEIQKGWTMFSPDFTATAGPWGVSFAANLTSDGTGIGNWTEEQFLTAIRKGKYKGLENSRDLLPPMPWFAYRNMPEEDLKSIFAYLRTTKPVENVVPAPRLAAAPETKQ
ncbi:MAG: diheme cytochrome c-553 [Bacteroidetes bacterium]|nr:diheme cytochrome c-553 [Bacteroidota bacterium]